MQKKGQLEIIGFIIVLTVVIVGGYLIIEATKKSDLKGIDYVGNLANKKVCSVESLDINIPKENLIYFKSLEDALKLNFSYSSNCE